MIYPIARLPDAWLEAGRVEGAYIDPTLKSPWQLFAAFDGSTAFGFIGLLLTSQHRATIRGWYVFPEQRGNGHGTDLLCHAIRWAADHDYTDIDIRTAHDVTWAGFQWTGYQREGGNQEKHYSLTVDALVKC